MTSHSILGEAVRAWTEERLPGCAGVADHAARVAVSSYEAGASVSEACRRARRDIECWVQHPANGTLRLISSNQRPRSERARVNWNVERVQRCR